MSQSNVRRSGGRRVQQKKTNTNRNLIIAAVVGVVLIMVAAGIALSRSSASANIAGQQRSACWAKPDGESFWRSLQLEM